MIKYDKFVGDFTQFCMEAMEIKDSSAKSYLSYLNSAVNRLSWPKTTLKEKVEKDRSEKLLEDFTYLLVKVDEQLAAPSPTVSCSRKSLSNYKSAILAFNEYLIGLGPSGKRRKTAVPAGGNVKLSHDDLVRIFKNRIKTQDRVYDDCALPFRTYQRMLGGSPAYEAALREYVEKIVFIVTELDDTTFENTLKVHLKDIDHIELKSKHTVVYMKAGSPKKLLTEAYGKNGGTMSFAELWGTQADLTLDHRIPLHGLRAGILARPEMRKLSDALLDYGTANPKIAKTELSREFAKVFEPSAHSIDLRGLTEELFDFLDGTELVIMDRSENSRKNKNVTQVIF